MAVNKWFPYTHQIYQVLRAAVMDWIDHRASSKGAALAFYTLFSLAPILVLVIAVAGFFYGAEAAQGQLLNELRGLVGAQGADTIQAILAGRLGGSGRINYRKGPGWTHAQVQRMAKKRRNKVRNRLAHR